MSEKPNGLCKALWYTWDDFWQRTNISGVNNAGNARKSLLRRAVWIVISCAFTYLTIKAVIDVIEDYIEYPVTTTIAVAHKDRVC